VTEKHYGCFISYRHADNRDEGRQWASWLHHALETYEVPKELVGTRNERGEVIPEWIFPVFRDEEELATGNITERIYAALGRSRVLVVVCSPRALESNYVDQEIRYFKTMRGNASSLFAIHAAIVEGDPSATAGRPQTCFPEALRYELTDGVIDPQRRAEILAADFRLSDGTQGWTSPEAYRVALQEFQPPIPKSQITRLVSAYEERLRQGLLKLIAGILGVPYGTLRARDKAYQLKRATIAAAQQTTHLARALHANVDT
jgi:TIR domain